VSRVVVAWLALPEIAEMLSTLSGGNEQVARARAEAARLRTELEEWRRLGEDGEVSAVAYARAEKGLTRQIAEQEAIARQAGVPPVLRGMIGEHAVQRWAELGDEVARKREIIRTVADIGLLPGGQGPRSAVGPRLRWRWLLGPDADEQPQAGSEAV
jgi:site-specific DNA recombinase